jgi:hypothetical protein
LTALELAGGRRLSVFTVTYHTAATGVHHDPRDRDRVTGSNGILVDTPNDERAAAGLPIDHDGGPSAPHQIDPNHPYELTETRSATRWASPGAARPTAAAQSSASTASSSSHRRLTASRCARPGGISGAGAVVGPSRLSGQADRA